VDAGLSHFVILHRGTYPLPVVNIVRLIHLLSCCMLLLGTNLIHDFTAIFQVKRTLMYKSSFSVSFNAFSVVCDGFADVYQYVSLQTLSFAVCHV